MHPSLYATIVSEFMLQQTQIKTVLPYFARWMERFPDLQSLTSAEESTVLKYWEGLGYYSRARRLHALAKDIAALGDQLPRTAAGWRQFKGIGPYTAAAIASIAFGSRDACVDGNVVRVIARLTNDRRTLGAGSAAAKLHQPIADALLDPETPGLHNQAMMELGSLICTKSSPMCTLCPVLAFCAGAKAGSPEQIPNLERPATEQRLIDRILVIRNGNILLHRARKGRLTGIAELPDAADLQLPDGWRARATYIGTIRRSITRFRHVETVLSPAPDDTWGLADEVAEHIWLPVSALPDATLSGPHRDWLDQHLRPRE
jgi:A/G-specific adenine glycosylase